MKRCPKCNREYSDNSLRFCLDDGGQLVRQDRKSAEPTLVANLPPSLETNTRPNVNRVIPIVVIVLVLAAALGVTWMLLRPAQPATNGNANTSANANTNSDGSVTIPAGAEPAHVRGNANAPVTLEEFADFQCPSCGAYYPELKKIESEFGDKLRVVFRERPLVPPHDHALLAAQAAEAAGLQNKFWEMHDKLYENQTAWSTTSDLVPVFVDYAKQIGLDTDRFMKDLNGEAVATRIFQDGKRVHALNVNSTPTFFVNGKEAKDDQWKPEGLRAMIRQAIQEAGK
jgi:protein-disulfide isomerase